MKQNNPWKVQQKRLIYDNPWIHVEEHQVLNPAGKPGIYGTVSFKNRAVAIVPLAENGDTWLVGQYRYPLEQYHWEIPMGGAPHHEAPEQCALRELKEETGLLAKQLQPLCHLHLSNSITDEEAFAFVATDLQQGETEFEETEVITVRRLPFSDALAMALSGEITDAVSVAALQRVRLLGIA